MNWPASSAFRFASASLFSTALLFAAAGCEDPNDLGVELPGTAPINTEYRDYPVTASTVLQLPVETLNSTHVLAGRVLDAKLGTTTARAFFNLQIPVAGIDTTMNPSYYANPLLDSVVVVAGFDQVFGSSAKPVSYDVYNLASPLSDRGTYNSSTPGPLGSLLAADRVSSLNRTKVEQQLNGLKTRVLNADKTAYVETAIDSTTAVTVPDRTVRLVLYRKAVGKLPEVPSDFAQDIFASIKSKNATFTQAVLNDKWKGLALLPTAGFSNAVVGFNRTLENRVLFYYHTDKAKEPTPLPYPLSFGNFSGAANAPRAYTQLETAFTAPFDQLTDRTKSVAPTTDDQAAYIQEGVGLGTKLEIPGLAELVSNREGLAINRAELIVPVKPYTNILFQAPPSPVLYELDASNKILQRIINISSYERIVQANNANQQGVSINATGSFFNVSPTNKYYSIGVTSYLQSYVYDALAGERPAALMLYPVVRYSPTAVELTLNRAVLDAQNIKLRVYFSKLR